MWRVIETAVVKVTLLRNDLLYSNGPLGLSTMQQDQDKGPEKVCRGSKHSKCQRDSVVRIR